MVAAAIAAAGAVVAGTVAWSAAAARRLGQLEGICVALDMTMAHGLMDEPQRSMVSDALASPVNPYFDRMPLKRFEIARRCRQVSAERWNWN